MRRARKSPITQHNKYKQTDQLYDPLRNTLRKSRSKSKMSVSGVSNIPSDLHGSKVSKKMYQIDPDQAQRLEHEIYIPVDKVLKPTGDHQKIQGRKFIAIDMNEKIRNPISEEQFRILKSRQGIVNQTVYEFSSKQSSQKQTPIQAYGIIGGGEKAIDSRRRSKFYSPDIYSTNLYNRVENNQNKQPIVLLEKRASGADISGDNQGYNQNIRRLSSRESGKRLSSNNNMEQRQLDFNQIIGDNKGQEYGLTGNVDQNQQYRFRSGSYASKGIGSLNSGNRQSNKSGLSKNKSPYKYNLFSAIDEGVNSKCSSFGKNEIIAGRPDTKKWT